MIHFGYKWLLLVFIGIILSSQVYADCISSSNGLVSWWKFDNTVIDAQLLNNGTRYNFTDGYINGRYNQALQFDSSLEQFVEISDDATLNFGSGDFSVEFWINTVLGGTDILAKKDDMLGWAFYMDGGNITFDINGDNNPFVLSSTIINNGSWFHIVGVRETDNVSIYINGMMEDSADVGEIGDIDTADSMMIGMDPNVNNVYFNGTLDQIRVWNRSLNADEIIILYANDVCTATYASLCSLSITPTSHCNDTNTTAYCICNETEGEMKLYRNDTDVTSENGTSIYLGEGHYGYICNITESENYTSSSDTSDFEVLYCPLSSSIFCINDNYLQYYNVVTYDGEQHTLLKHTYCVNGCDNTTMACNPPEYQQDLYNLLIIIGFIVFMILMFAWVKGRRR